MSLQGACGGLTIIACDDVSILDEGTFQGEAAAINFTGAGVTTSVTDGVATVTINGGGSGSGTVETISIASANGFYGSSNGDPVNPILTINASALNATKIGTGVVDNTEFSYLNGVNGPIQAQISARQPNIQFQNQGVDVGSSGGISTVNFVGGAVVASATGGLLTIRVSATGGGATNPGGSDTQVQFNDGGSFGGDANFTWNKTTRRLAVSGAVSATTFNGVAITNNGSAGKFLNEAGGYVNVSASTIGASTLGTQLITAPTTTAAQDALGGGSFGKVFFSTATTAAAQSLLNQTNGTVTQVFLASANGFFGTVSNATSQPVISINASGLDAAKIANGSVSNTEYQYLNGVTSDIQTQLNAKQASGNYITAVSGDITINGPGNVTGTLATVNAAIGTFGSAAGVGSFLVNDKGLITSASNVPIAIPSSQVTDGGAFGRLFFATATTAAALNTLGGVTGTGAIVLQTSASLNNPTFSSARANQIVLDNTGLQILDSDGSHSLSMRPTSNLAADVVLGISMGGNRTLKLDGNFTVSGATTITTYGATITGAATTAAAQDVLGGGAFGKVFFSTATTAAAQALLNQGSGTVTSVGVSGGNGITVAGSPVTSSGTITIDVSGLPTSKIAGGAFGRSFFATATTAAAQALLNQTSGTVTSVGVSGGNGITVAGSPITGSGTITIDVSGLPTSKIAGGAFGRTFFATATTAAALAQLTGGTVGIQLFSTATTVAAQQALGAGTAGIQLFQATTTAAAQNQLGIGAAGRGVFQATTTAAAQSALGSGTVGAQLFATATTAAAQGVVGISTFGASLVIAADATAARTTLLTPGSVITGVSGASAIGNIVSLTSGNYASLTPVATTVYIITDAN